MEATVEPKHVVALLDRSWEPSLRPSVDMIQDVALNMLRRQDSLGVATTAGEWLINLEPKTGREAKLTRKIQAACELSAGIALDQCILLCLERLAAAARKEDASQWLLVFGDGYGGDRDSVEAEAAREALVTSEVNIVFVNMQHYQFYPDDDHRWEDGQRDVDAFVEAAHGRGHEWRLQTTGTCEASEREQFMQFLKKILPDTKSCEESTEIRRHREHALVLRELRNAMEKRHQESGSSRGSTEKIFAELDQDGSGVLDHRELKLAMRKIGVRLTATQVEHLAEALDHNGDGIDHAELAEFLHGAESRAERIAKLRKEEEYHKRVEETHKRQKWEEEQRQRAEKLRIAKEKERAERLEARLKRESEIRQQGLAHMEAYSKRPSFGGVPSMRARLEASGAKFGQMNCSLLWQNDHLLNGQSDGADLDLLVKPPRDREISVSNRLSGGGTLDVDNRHDDPNPVENIFFDELQPGCYTVKVSCRDGGHVPKNFECTVLVSTPGRVRLKGILNGVRLKQVEGEEILVGARMISGAVYGTGYLHAVTVCELEVREPEPESPELQSQQESELPQEPDFQSDRALKPLGTELLSAFRDHDEVLEAFGRLRMKPGAVAAAALGLVPVRSSRRLRALTQGSLATFGASRSARLRAENPYRMALQEVSERVAAQRQEALLTEERETEMRRISTPRVSGLPRRSTEAAQHRILNELSRPNPTWCSREGRPSTAVLQRTSVSCWEPGWCTGMSDNDRVGAVSSESEYDELHQNEVDARLSPVHGSSAATRHPACHDAEAIFERVRRHMTQDECIGQRPRSREELLRRRGSPTDWPVSSLPAIQARQ